MIDINSIEKNIRTYLDDTFKIFCARITEINPFKVNSSIISKLIIKVNGIQYIMKSLGEVYSSGNGVFEIRLYSDGADSSAIIKEIERIGIFQSVLLNKKKITLVTKVFNKEEMNKFFLVIDTQLQDFLRSLRLYRQNCIKKVKSEALEKKL